MRVVATLTTMPDRYHKVVETIKSLRKQTFPLDAIYLGLPVKSERLNIPYPEPTEEMNKLCTVVRCKDYGPITKLLGALLSEQNPDTIIISFDDDMIYPRDMVQALVNKQISYPGIALGSSGMLVKYDCPSCAITPNEKYFHYNITKFYIPPDGRLVDSIYGYPGALYLRRHFPEVDNLYNEFLRYAMIDFECFMNDDVIISGYLSLVGVERRIFGGMPCVGHVLSDEGEYIHSNNEISLNTNTFFSRMNKSIATAKANGMFAEPAPVALSEGLAGIAFIIFLCIVVLLLSIFYIYSQPDFPLFW